MQCRRFVTLQLTLTEYFFKNFMLCYRYFGNEILICLSSDAQAFFFFPLLHVLHLTDFYFLMATMFPLLGINYTSKLDEFENFVERIRKYGLILSSSTEESKSPTVLLIDDLPVMNGKVSFQRLQNCLHLLVQSTRIPTAILLTDYSKTDSADHTGRCLEELQLRLESAGACKVTFLNKLVSFIMYCCY